MPLFVVECEDVKALSNSQINLLRCGDYLVKKDASGEHAYKVTFKKEGVGMCLTYMDASVIETQSYDYVDGEWVYNSEDKTPNLLDAQTEDDVKALVEGGTLENAKPIYEHLIILISGGISFSISLFNNSETQINTWDKLKSYMVDNSIQNINANGCACSETIKLVTSHLYNSGTAFSLYGIDLNTNGYTNVVITNTTFTTQVDIVKKIN